MADQGPRPAGWKKDPTGRHFGRYWDGAAWTENVISAEKVSADQASTTEATLSHVQVIPPSSAPAPTPPTAPTTTGPKTTFGNGQYRVGTDIAPGTYVAPGGSGCYWERQATFGGGSLGDIIANDLSSGGQVVVTISASDKGFKTSGCGTWRPG